MIYKFPEVDGLKDFPSDVAEYLLQNTKKHQSRECPYWIQVMGIPGSGKTTLVHMLQGALDEKRTPYTLAAFDEYMEQIPEYQVEADRAVAFAKFEAPARAVGFEIFKELITRKVDVLFEHSTSFSAVRDLMYFVKQSGYTLILIRVGVDVEIAKQRVVAREKFISRHVPEALIEERAVITEDRWNELSKIADAKFFITNNGERNAQETFCATVDQVCNFVEAL